MEGIFLTIPGKPQGKERPRFNSQTKHTYTPAKTTAYEALIKRIYIDKYGVQCYAPEGAVVLEICAFFPIPKSASKKTRQEMKDLAIPVTKKPDIDNITKIVMDGLNGLAYKDDAQVAAVKCYKSYGEASRVSVTICTLGGNDL